MVLCRLLPNRGGLSFLILGDIGNDGSSSNKRRRLEGSESLD